MTYQGGGGGRRGILNLKGHHSKGHVGLKGLGTTLAFGVTYSPLHWCTIQDGIVTPVSFLVDHSIPVVEN